MREGNPYEVQIGNVKWECDGQGNLVIRVNLYGEGVLAKSGLTEIVGRSAGYQQVDERLWSEYAFSLVVLRRLPGFEEKLASRQAARSMTLEERSHAQSRRMIEQGAERAGITVRQYEALRDARARQKAWREAPGVYERLYGVPLPGYVGSASPKQRKSGGRRRKAGR